CYASITLLPPPHSPLLPYTTLFRSGLELAIARLLGGAAGGIAFDQKQFAAADIAAGTIGEFARQGRTTGHTFAFDLFRFAQARLRAADAQRRQLFGFFGVLIEPEAE